MTYISLILMLLLVVFPLFIPVGVHVVHAVRTWRPRPRLLVPAIAPQGGRRQLALEAD